MPESNYLEPVRNHLADTGKHLRMALSAFDPEGVASGHDEYADLEYRLRSRASCSILRQSVGVIDSLGLAE